MGGRCNRTQKHPCCTYKGVTYSGHGMCIDFCNVSFKINNNPGGLQVLGLGSEVPTPSN